MDWLYMETRLNGLSVCPDSGLINRCNKESGLERLHNLSDHIGGLNVGA